MCIVDIHLLVLMSLSDKPDVISVSNDKLDLMMRLNFWNINILLMIHMFGRNV